MKEQVQALVASAVSPNLEETSIDMSFLSDVPTRRYAMRTYA